MSRFRDWFLGAKLITIGAAGLLLTFGLCSVGTGFEQRGTPFQDFAAGAGVITFFVSLLLLVIGVIGVIGRALGMWAARPKDDQR